jgi:ABC-2 type transport system permease protein
MPALLVGMVGQNFTWITVRGVVMLVSAWLLGANLLWSHAPVALLVLFLIVLSHAPIGVIAAALVLSVRTTGPLPAGAVWVSSLLGGVYYPTTVVPSWLSTVSAFVPMTYGLRALRQTLIEGAPASAIFGDVVRMIGLGAALAVVAVLLFGWALGYAKRAGTLAQY